MKIHWYPKMTCLFLNILKDGIKQDQEGFYPMPLPFREQEPKLPCNKKIALTRLDSLKVDFKGIRNILKIIMNS
jgi:hypothetical protein